MGTNAFAQGLSLQQRILMPGPLTADHAEYESNCENCHSPFERDEMTSLCLSCHEEVAEDRSAITGFHGQNSLAFSNPCESCHTDHEGRDFSINGLLPDTFDHSETRFLLQGAHALQACESCHLEDDSFRQAVTECAECHADQDIHQGTLGDTCDNCHQSQSWQQLLDFDHDTTEFGLQGKHADVTCSSCHLGQQFQFEDTGCVTCHSISDVHGGTYGDNCDGCHTVEGWEEVSFDHDETIFPLDGAHENTLCISCHGEDQLKEPAVPTAFQQVQITDQPLDRLSVSLAATTATTESLNSRTCSDCHKDDDLHFGRNGELCDSCHVSTDWQETFFDHNVDTEYSLVDAHAEAACTQCHTGVLTDPLEQDCFTCHVGDDVHQDSGMKQCDSCHSTVNWNSVASFDHEFTQFPLLGMHQITPCESCHVDGQLTSVDAECVICHEVDDFHERSIGSACADCHTPNAWELWQFDHAEQTDYVLQGRHEGLSCDSCHLPATDPLDTPEECGSCHVEEDIHRGDYGDSCDQCHNTTDFSEVIITGRRL